tara:strand:+ start:18455 stop:19039 length:585 start_codon:yes stop_codon:yes gene_type:complete
MQVERLDIPGVFQITPARFGDPRGYFSVTHNQQALADAGMDLRFCQDNQSWSAAAGTVRGLHFQSPPASQAKLVRAVTGSILDVVVDARVGSPTYGQHLKRRLDSATGAQLLVPHGCLHGFVTLEADTIVFYKVDAYYAPALEDSISWNDPDLGIDWGVSPGEVSLSDKDANAMAWSDFVSPFVYEPQPGESAQ